MVGCYWVSLVYLLLPAFNEEESLPGLLESIEKTLDNYHVVVVNDGSNDRTQQIVKKYSHNMPMTIINHHTNRGLGAALRTGIFFLAKTAEPESAVVTMDSDLTHDPMLIHNLTSKMTDGYDIVVASRYVLGGSQKHVKPYRSILSRGLNVFVQMLGSEIKDNSSGFRCFRVRLLKKAIQYYGDQFITERGFAASVEILLKLQNLNAKICEVPMNLDYSKKKGLSKLSLWKTIISYLRLLFLSRSWVKPD
jgi:dolichol-phosphate mannosyltransferase